jgi:manganese/iron transport system permease protein/iron/zinc/copper transport system permease protein
MFSLVLAATIVVSMQVLGVMLIAAAIIIPPVVARLLTDSFKNMMLLSTGIGAFCGLGGIYGSFYLNVSSGASVVLFSVLLFVLALIYSNFKSRISGVTRRAVGVAGLQRGHSSPLD